MKINRETKIQLIPVDQNTYNVIDKDGNTLLESNQDYFIYLKNVNFKDSVITGRYLGNTDNSIIDGYCREVSFDGTDFYKGDKVVRTAKMVAVDNKNKTVIILEN